MEVIDGTPPDNELPSPVLEAADVVTACHEAESLLRAATELIGWAVQRAVTLDKVPLAAVLDARNAELKRAAICLGLTAQDVRAELTDKE